MEDRANILAIKLEPSSEQAIAMLNALMISSSFGEKPTQRTGLMTKGSMDLVVLSSISGKQTNGQMHIQLTPVRCLDITDVLAVSVEMAQVDRMESVIRMDAI